MRFQWSQVLLLAAAISDTALGAPCNRYGICSRHTLSVREASPFGVGATPPKVQSGHTSDQPAGLRSDPVPVQTSDRVTPVEGHDTRLASSGVDSTPPSPAINERPFDIFERRPSSPELVHEVPNPPPNSPVIQAGSKEGSALTPISPSKGEEPLTPGFSHPFDMPLGFPSLALKKKPTPNIDQSNSHQFDVPNIAPPQAPAAKKQPEPEPST